MSIFCILIYKYIHVTITIYVSGVVNDDLDFSYGSDVSLKFGCAVTLKGLMWYFGGSNDMSRQVSFKVIQQVQKFILKMSLITGCEINRQSDLPFDFSMGSCNTFKTPEEKAMLCFNAFNRRDCHL